MPLRDQDIDAVAKIVGPASRRLFQAISDSINNHSKLLGVDPSPSQNARTDQQLASPKLGQIIVAGANGHFYVNITSPLPGVDRTAGPVPKVFEGSGTGFRSGDPWGEQDARQSRMLDTKILNDGRRLGRLLHELQSSTTLNFDAAGSVTTYGPSSQTFYDILDPNQQKYWRFRSRYENSDFGAYVYYINPQVCGPVQVDSGLLSSTAIVLLNQSNTPTSQPLTQSGVSTTILVASTTWKMGTQTLVYNAGSVNPGGFGTYYVYGKDPQRRGGVITYLASTSNPDVTGDDGIVYFGKITTAGGGGGLGGGGGNGPCCIGEVVSELYDGEELPQSQLRKGMVLKGGYGSAEPIMKIEMVPDVPCFRYVGDNGLILKGCSADHSLQYDGGGFDRAFLIIEGHRLETVLGPTRVCREFIGHHTVYKLTLGGPTKTYRTDGYISHNVLKP